MTMVKAYEVMDLCTIHDQALWARRNSPDLWLRHVTILVCEKWKLQSQFWAAVREDQYLDRLIRLPDATKIGNFQFRHLHCPHSQVSSQPLCDLRTMPQKYHGLFREAAG